VKQGAIKEEEYESKASDMLHGSKYESWIEIEGGSQSEWRMGQVVYSTGVQQCLE
jgi:hypothetical protein